MMKKAGTRNPVFLLDEVDKMAADFRGDPSAALLEVLDPEQNHAFLDHYLDTEYDLSNIMFIATANVVHTIPPALKDRMEIIRIAGYTLNEKLSIAQRYLIPKQIEAHGLKDAEISFEDAAVVEVVERFTREAGVRNLEREIASLCRKIARKVVAGEAEKPIVLTSATGPRDARRPALPPGPRHGARARGGRRDRARLDRNRRRDPEPRGHADAGPRQGDAHRPAGRRHAGIRAGRALLHPHAGGGFRHRPAFQPEVRSSTFTSPKGRSRRTGPRRASRWRRRSRR